MPRTLQNIEADLASAPVPVTTGGAMPAEDSAHARIIRRG